MYWNRAKYVEAYERSETSQPWKKTKEFIEILEPVRSLSHLPSATPERPLVLESCEFLTTIIPTDGAVRQVIPGEGWTVQLWGATQATPKPRILLRIKGMIEAAEFSDPQTLSFFHSTRLLGPPSEWPPVPAID